MVTRECELHNKKTRSQGDSAWRHKHPVNAGRHRERIRFHPDYTTPQFAANLFILTGVKVRHGAVAGRLLKGGRA